MSGHLGEELLYFLLQDILDEFWNPQIKILGWSKTDTDDFENRYPVSVSVLKPIPIPKKPIPAKPIPSPECGKKGMVATCLGTTLIVATPLSDQFPSTNLTPRIV